MATATNLQILRRLIDEADETTYTDAELTARLTVAAQDLNTVAYAVWQEKMAAASTLVSMSEGGSSRSLNQVYDHAAAMVTHYKTLVQRTDSGATVLRKITRV